MQALAVVLTVALVVALVIAARERFDGRRRIAAEIERLGRDTVNREQLSEALAAREALLTGLDEPALVFAADGRLLRANRAARKHVPELVAGDQQTQLSEPVTECIAAGQRRTADVTVYHPERRRYRVTLQPYTTRDGQACVAVLTDTSAQDDYRDARRLFSAGVSHELRTPLARILALVDTLALPLADAERDTVVEQMRAEVDAMRELIEDMILLVRLESHELTGVGERTDVSEAVERCVEQHRQAAREREMHLTGEATRGLVVAVTERLMDVVLNNLVTNAIRYAGAGARIEVRARGLAGAVELEVQDTGVGIAAEHLDRVFERFYRVEHARSSPGTGLGLAIVKHIAEEYGGRATAESTVGSGTLIRVVLPAPAALQSQTRMAGETVP
jgi:two-component system, OmpR family, phosphate regulon sensor histidine kinase PhoR